MDHPAGSIAGDPARGAIGKGGAAIKAGGEFQGDERQASGDAFDETCGHGLRLGGADAFGHGNAGGAQHGMATATDAGIGVCDAGDDAGNASQNQRLGAGRGLAVVGAGFKRDIGGGPARGIACLCKRHAFSMRTTAGLGDAAPNDAAIPHDHAANGRVRPHSTKAPGRKAKGMGHVIGIAHSSEDALGRSSDTKRSKSSAAWKFLYTLANRT